MMDKRNKAFIEMRELGMTAVEAQEYVDTHFPKKDENEIEIDSNAEKRKWIKLSYDDLYIWVSDFWSSSAGTYLKAFLIISGLVLTIMTRNDSKVECASEMSGYWKDSDC